MPSDARPPRPAEMQPYVDNGLMWSTFLSLGGPVHASMSENARPMEPVSLDDMRQRFEHAARGIRSTVRDALYLVFWSRRLRAPPEKGLRVPPEHLWWVAMPGDTALLSDGVTHHYTSVGLVDREAETITFHDPWPDDFFLHKKRNVLGIEADGCRITRAEFEQVATGLLTWDTLRLIDHYFNAFAEQGTSADQRMRAGHAVMLVGEEYFAGRAIKHFAQAMILSDEAGDETLALRAAACGWLAGMCALSCAISNGDTAAQTMLQPLIELPARRAPPRELMRHLLPHELCRLAHNVGRVGELQLAEVATSLALEKMPDFEDAYRLRSMARCRSEPAAAAADAQRALALNAAATATLEAEVARLRLDEAAVAAGMTRTWLDERRYRRTQALDVFIAACANAGDHAAARDAAVELCALRPDDVTTLHKRFVLEQMLGNAAGTNEAARVLARLELPPELRAAVDAVLSR